MVTKKREFLKNIVYAFGAQGITLVLSVFMSLVVPKFLGIREFGYWQLFIFYSTYIGLLHFGLNEGIYLKYGGKKYEQLNFRLIGSQFWYSIFIQLFIVVVIALLTLFFISDPERSFVIQFTCLHVLIYNSSVLFGYLFQAVGDIKLYSRAIFIEKITFIIFMLALLLLGSTSFRPLIILFLLAKIISISYYINKGKEFIFIKLYSFRTIFNEFKNNIISGSHLLLSNIANTLIFGIGRFFVDKRFGIEVFGKISFSLSLAGFFLLFVTQIGIVLFPTLRQASTENQKKIYELSRGTLGILLSSIYIFYFPLSYVVNIWLPEYSESLKFLILLLPLCVFDGKTLILCGTFLKVLRKEKFLLKINIISVIISFILCYLSVFIYKNLYFLTLSLVISVGIRSFIAEKYLSKIMGIKIIKEFIYEISLSAIFVLLTWNFMPLTAWFLTLTAFLIYLLLNLSKIKFLYQSIKNKH